MAIAEQGKYQLRPRSSWADHAGSKLPDAPKTPHFPHGRRIAGFALAGSLALTAVTGIMLPSPTGDPEFRGDTAETDLMRYPWDSGRILLEFKFDEETQEYLGAEPTDTPYLIDKGDGTFTTPVFGAEYGDPKDPMGHIKIVLEGEPIPLEGGVWEKEIDAQGQAILDSEGQPKLHPYGWVEQESDRIQVA